MDFCYFLLSQNLSLFLLDRPFCGHKSYTALAIKRRRGSYCARITGPDPKYHLAREFEDAVVEVLLKKTRGALEETSAKTLVLGGGVAANKEIRRTFGALQEFRNRYASLPHSGTFKDWQLDKLEGFSKNTSLSADQIKNIWYRAANAADQDKGSDES